MDLLGRIFSGPERGTSAVLYSSFNEEILSISDQTAASVLFQVSSRLLAGPSSASLTLGDDVDFPVICFMTDRLEDVHEFSDSASLQRFAA